jgi:hypothetical protein
MTSISHAEQFCDTCILAKHRRRVFSKQSKYRADKALELVHGDLCGQVKPATPVGGAISYCSLTMPPAICGLCS